MIHGHIQVWEACVNFKSVPSHPHPAITCYLYFRGEMIPPHQFLQLRKAHYWWCTQTVKIFPEPFESHHLITISPSMKSWLWTRPFPHSSSVSAHIIKYHFLWVLSTWPHPAVRSSCQASEGPLTSSLLRVTPWEEGKWLGKGYLANGGWKWKWREMAYHLGRSWDH